MTVKSHYDSDSVIPFPPTPPDSKESSSLEGVRRVNSGPSAKQVQGNYGQLIPQSLIEEVLASLSTSLTKRTVLY